MNWPRFSTRKAEAFVAALLLGVALGGCQARESLQHSAADVLGGVDEVLYLYVGVRDNAFDIDGHRRDFSSTFRALEQQFRSVHPRKHFVVQLYPEKSLLRELTMRNANGLGPDLLLVTNRTALQLASAGLTRPPQLPARAREAFDPWVLQRASLANPPRLAGIPVARKAQLACFNTSRLPQSPTTLDELLAVSASGKGVGLTLDPAGIYWSVGALGANEAVLRAVAGQPLTLEQRDALLGWTRWLQKAAIQQKVTFYGNQEVMLEALATGQVDWISCHSIDLERLRRRLGSRLGVSALPDGPQHMATPVNELTVIALGVNSSPQQRRSADAFALFATNPLVQRNITVSLREVLPVNRFVNVPAESSMVLKAMLRAQQQAKDSESITALIHANDLRVERFQGLITRLVFGESTPEQTATHMIQALKEPR
jgi:maltose-binding protein MalE